MQTNPACEAPALGAYETSDGNERWEVVFAASEPEARARAAVLFDVAPEEVARCRRVRALDRYAHCDEVPALALLEAGWRFDCPHCGNEIDSDGSEDADSEPVEPVVLGREVYCGRACVDGEQASRTQYAAQKAAAVEAASGRFPGIVIDSVYEQCDFASRERRWCVRFAFPGSAVHATWTLGTDYLLIDRAGQPALAQYLAQLASAHPGQARAAA